MWPCTIELTDHACRPACGSTGYEMAGVTAQDIRIAEVRSCFTIAEIIAGEDLGFFPAKLSGRRRWFDGPYRQPTDQYQRWAEIKGHP
jgi:hypothetical protein